MLPNRIHISARSTELLRQVKSKTGVTPNILCRMALMLSLHENHKPNIDTTDLNGQEFNLPTLFGDATDFYQGILKEVHGELGSKEAQLIFAAHIDNGADKLKRVKSVLDLLKYNS